MTPEFHVIEYPAGIHCLDTHYHRPRLAACYLVREGDQAALIDTGVGRTVPLVLELLQRLGMRREQVRYVIPTHVHLDHAAASGELMRLFPRARLLVHPAGARHLIDPTRLIASATAVYGEEKFRHDFGEILPVPAERVIAAEDGLTVELNGRPLRCLDTPGHARHHLCVYDQKSRGLFTGDTFGICYPELTGPAGPFALLPTTPVQFDPAAWRASLERLLGLAPERLFLTHFGEIMEPPRIANQLHAWLDVSECLCEPLDAATPVEEIRQQLREIYRERIEAARLPLPTDQVLELLTLDLNLNAQGLAVWLSNRQVARASAA